MRHRQQQPDQQQPGSWATSVVPERPVSAGTQNRIARTLLGLSVCAVLAACASQDIAPPVAEMTRAEASIENAIQAGARDAAPIELQSAQRHFSQAQQATANEEYREALWLAEKSEADAELAEAKSRTEQAYGTVAELKEGIRVLQDELEREAGSNLN